jgi:MFS family permease
MTESAPGMFTTLRHRGFALMWSGQALSSIGNTMFPIILALLVLDRHSGAEALGAVLAVQALAMAAGTGLASAVGDRWRRTRVMLGSDVVRGVAVAIIAAAPLRLNTVVFYVLVIAIGVAEGMFQPAYGAVVPRLLPEERLQGGNSLTALSQYVAMVAGPVLAGALIAAVGSGPALWVDTGTFAASIVTLMLIRETVPDEPEAAESEAGGGGSLRRGLSDFAEGLREVRERPWVGASIFMATLVMTLSVAPAFLAAPIVARERLGGAAAYGAAFTALGVGSIIGSLVAARIRTSRPGLVGVCGIFTIFGSVGSLAVLPLAGVLVFWAIAGIGVTVFQVMWLTALQREIPDRVLGRVMALDWLGSQGLMPVGYALAGVVVAAVGTRSMLIGCAVLVLIAAPLPLLVRGGKTFSTPTVPAEPRMSQL